MHRDQTGFVAQLLKLLYRQVCNLPCQNFTLPPLQRAPFRRLKTGDTADYKSALHSDWKLGHVGPKNGAPSNDRPVRHDAALGNDDNSVADVVQGMVHILRLAGGRDYHVVADPGIFVDDGIIDPRI